MKNKENEYLVLIHNKQGIKNAIYKAKNEEELIEKIKKCGDTLIAILNEETITSTLNEDTLNEIFNEVTL